MSMITVIEKDDGTNEIQRFINMVAEGKHLSLPDAGRVFQIIMNGGATPSQIAAMLMGLRLNKETIDEISGAAMALRNKAKKLPVPDYLRGKIIDTCGTGGDKKGTYNISTTVAFVLAGCGVPVAKHGNRAISSKSGSADVLTALGINIETTEEITVRCLEEAGICFMMAPRFHSAMKHVAPVRQELAMRSIFNLIGPLINPAMPEKQLLGVYDKAWIKPLAYVLDNLGTNHAWVVNGSDGMDEITLSGETHIAELKESEVRTFILNPEEFGIMPPEDESELAGGDAHVNAQAMRYVLSGAGKDEGDKFRAYRDIVLLNAAAGLVVAGKVSEFSDGLSIAAQTLDDGNAKKALEKLVEVSNL